MGSQTHPGSQSNYRQQARGIIPQLLGDDADRFRGQTLAQLHSVGAPNFLRIFPHRAGESALDGKASWEY